MSGGVTPQTDPGDYAGMWVVGRLAVYDTGKSLVGVELDTGKRLWRSAARPLFSGHAAGLLADGDTGWIIRLEGGTYLNKWRRDQAVTAQVIRVDLDTGRVRGQESVPLGKVACAGDTGRCDAFLPLLHGGLSPG